MKGTLVEGLLRHRHLILSIIFLTVALGFIGFRSMPLNLFPDANYPVISVLIPWPGASAADVEDKVTRVLEKELSTIDLVRKVRSVSQDEMAAVSVEFQYEKGLDAASTDVANTIKRIEAKLPDTVLPPEIFRVSDATKPVVTIALFPKEEGHLDLEKVRQLADNEIKEEFLRIPEVANVEVFGGYLPEITIEVDQRKLHAYGLGIESIVAAVRAQNLNIPDGLIIHDQGQYLLKTKGERLEKSKLSAIVVGHANGGDIYLGDVASVRTGFKERQAFFRGNGRQAVGLNLMRPESGHVTTTISAVEKALPRIKAHYPAISFEIVDTQKDLIETSISNMVGSLRDAIIMTVAVIFIMLADLRISILAAISIPFTYFMTFAAMYLFGYELNIVTLTAVIVAVGLLLDDAIVVIENIERHFRSLGKPIKEAVRDGLNEILLADWSGTFTTILVLVPIMFIGGYVEKILRQFTVVLALALLSSYIVSVTVIPIFAPLLVSRTSGKSALERFLGLFDTYLLEPVKGFFSTLIHFALEHKVLFILPAVAFFIVTMRFILPIAGRDLMPPMDTGIVKISFELDSGSSIHAVEDVAKRIEGIVKEMPGLKRISTKVGSEPGIVSFGTGRIPQQGIITAHFIDRFHRPETIWEIEDEIRNRASGIPGIKYLDVYDFGATPLSSIKAPVDIMISGPDARELDRIASIVEKRLMTVRGLTTVTRSWTMDKKEIYVDVDIERAGRYGLDPVAISSQLKTAIKGGVASVLRVPGEDGYTIRVQYPEKDRDSISDVKSIYLASRFGPVPLEEIASIGQGFTRTKFTRQDLMPTVDVYGYRATASITHLQSRIEEALNGLNIPDGYSISHEGEVKNMQEAGIRLAKALGLAVILLFFSLVPTFKSWTDPISIMIAIPLAMIGAAWSLVLWGRHACMPANMGMILLAGIVVNNSILLIDFIKKARSKGAGIREAIEDAVRTRTRPILMTASSTIVGMIPIAAERALGLERLSPLAVVAIGGLVVSTFLTLIYVPIFYELLENTKKWARKLRGLERHNVNL